MTTAKKTTTTRKAKTSTSTRKSPARKPRTVAVKKKELPPNPLVSEILDAVDSERVKAKKLDLLQKYASDGLKTIFIWNFDETVVSLLPDGTVPYQPLDGNQQADPSKGMPQRTTINASANKFFNFVKGGNDAMNKIKREGMFINMLEQLHPTEAEILILTKDKALGSKYNITKELVSEAYPDIRWGGRS